MRGGEGRPHTGRMKRLPSSMSIALPRVLAGNRIAVPEEALPAHEKIRKFVEEVLP